MLEHITTIIEEIWENNAGNGCKCIKGKKGTFLSKYSQYMNIQIVRWLPFLFILTGVHVQQVKLLKMI